MERNIIKVAVRSLSETYQNLIISYSILKRIILENNNNNKFQKIRKKLNQGKKKIYFLVLKTAIFYYNFSNLNAILCSFIF